MINSITLVLIYICLCGRIITSYHVEQQIADELQVKLTTKPECLEEVDEISNGDVLITDTSFQSLLTYECDEGYLLHGEKTRSCSETGEWIGEAPQCIEIDCGNAALPRKGYIRFQTGTKWNDMTIYGCNAGTSTIDRHSITAKCIVEDNKAKWSLHPPNCYGFCPLSNLNIENGKITIFLYGRMRGRRLQNKSRPVPHGTQFQVTCNKGYTLFIGDLESPVASLSCSDGAIVGIVPTCISVGEQLITPAAENIPSQLTMNVQTTTISTTTDPCELDPFGGCFQLLNNTPCTVLKPDHLLADGQMNVRSRLFPTGSVIKFRCTDIVRFKFNGDSTLKCINGRWNGTSPSCIQLREREYGNYPMIKYTVSDGVSSIDDDGSLIVSEGANLMLYCLWFKTNGEPTWVNLKLAENVRPPAWNRPRNEYSLQISNIQKNDATNYTCSVWGKANSFHLKIVSREYSTTAISANTVVEVYHLKAFCVKKYDNNIAVYRYQYIHGFDTMGSVVHGTNMTVICRNDYELLPATDYYVSTVGVSTCDDGRWNPDIRCEPARCMCWKIPAHYLANKFMMAKDCSIAKDHVTYISVACMEGYHTSQALQIECKYGKWDLGEIQYRRCVPDQDAGSITTNPSEPVQESNTSSGSDVYDSSTESVIKPPVDGSCSVRKPDYLLANGSTIVKYRRFSNGSVVKFRCTDIVQFKFLGQSILMCENGYWNGTSPSCIRLLERQYRNYPMIKYTVSEGVSSIDDDGSLIISEGANLMLHCLWFKSNGQPNWVDLRVTENVIPPAWNTAKNEYSIKILNIQKNDATKYTCSVWGKANSFHLKIVSREYSTTVSSAYTTVEEHRLKVKRCRQPPSIDNGNYIPESDVFTFGMHIHYVCDPGYFLEGDADSICLRDQTWLGSAPYCKAVECLEEVDDISHGRVVMSGTYFKSFLTYYCDEGYLLRGEKYRWCSETGEWDGEAPHCRKIDCGEPTPPRKGYIQPPYGTKWNDSITYACNASTINEFALTAKCIVEDNEPRWSLPPPDCYDNCRKKQNYDMTYSRYGNTYKHGIEVVVTCRKGSEVYPVSDSKETKFEALCDDGIWKPDSTCVPARCSCTALPNSWLMSRKFTTKNCDRFHEHDSDLHLECHSHYQHLRKNAVLQCRRGDWKPYPNDAVVGCEKRL